MRLILDDFLRDLAHGIRLLRRNTGFAAVIVSTLAVAIAATVTVFSIVDAWLLRPLNFPDADRLVIAFAATPDGRLSRRCGCRIAPIWDGRSRAGRSPPFPRRSSMA